MEFLKGCKVVFHLIGLEESSVSPSSSLPGRELGWGAAGQPLKGGCPWIHLLEWAPGTNAGCQGELGCFLLDEGLRAFP